MEKIQPFRKILFLLSFLILSSFCYTQVNEQWVRRYNGPGNDFDLANSLTVDANGNVYITGHSAGSGTSDDYATIKYDAAGNELWVRRYNGPANAIDRAHSIAVDASGNVYVTGGSDGSEGNSDYTTIKYDAAGNELWVKRYEGFGGGEEALFLTVDANGNIYITGKSVGSGGEGGFDFATIKYDAAGNEVWIKRYNGSGNENDAARSLAVDGSGNVYVTGESYGSGTDFDYATIKYDAAGNELWVKRYNGPANSFDEALFLAVDASGNVYVTGQSAGIGTGSDYASIKYDTNGNELWVKRYNGPGNSSDVAQSLAVNASGNVYVTGGSNGSGTGLDFATIKYDAAGNELWVRRYNGPGNAGDGGGFLAVDGFGNIYITGASNGGETEADYTTIKYDASGNELWVIRYNGPGNADDSPQSLAVDGSGNVYVTGWSFGNGTATDYATIKYTQTSVTDVSCGKKGDKVMVCHKGKTLCISPNAVDAHLKHGDQLGSCIASDDLNSITESGDASQLMEEMSKQFQVLVAPNPLNTVTRLQYELPADGEVSIKLYDMVGREVTTVVKSVQKAGVYNTGFNATDLAKGVYYYRALLTTKQKIYTQTGKLMVVK
jgi:hypothetical protein